MGIDINLDEDELRSPIGIITALQYFYFRMYTEVYLSAASLAMERHVQRAVEFGFRAGILNAETAWDLNDGALVHEIQTSKIDNELVREAQESIKGLTNGHRYVPIIALKYDQFKNDQFKREKVIPIDEEFKNKFLNAFTNPYNLTKLEQELSRQLSVPILCSVLPDPEKVKPSDVPLYSNGKKVATIREMRPSHYANLEEQARQFFAIRVLVPPQDQARMVHQHKDVADCFFETAKTYFERAA